MQVQHNFSSSHTLEGPGGFQKELRHRNTPSSLSTVLCCTRSQRGTTVEEKLQNSKSTFIPSFSPLQNADMLYSLTDLAFSTYHCPFFSYSAPSRAHFITHTVVSNTALQVYVHAWNNFVMIWSKLLYLVLVPIFLIHRLEHKLVKRNISLTTVSVLCFGMADKEKIIKLAGN